MSTSPAGIPTPSAGLAVTRPGFSPGASESQPHGHPRVTGLTEVAALRRLSLGPGGLEFGFEFGDAGAGGVQLVL